MEKTNWKEIATIRGIRIKKLKSTLIQSMTVCACALVCAVVVVVI